MFNFDVSVFHVEGIWPIAFPVICFFVVFWLLYLLNKKDGVGSISGALSVSVFATVVLSGMAFTFMFEARDSANENIQIINNLELEASELGLPLKNHITEVINQFPENHPEGFWEGMSEYAFLTENFVQSLQWQRFLTIEEYKVASQYIRHCYSGPEGDAAREYMATYPVSPHIVSKKLVKAQSMVADDAIKKDCLNAVSLTFLE